MSNGPQVLNLKDKSEFRGSRMYTGGKYMGEMLNLGRNLGFKSERDDMGYWSGKGLFGFASAAGDTSYYEVGTSTADSSILKDLLEMEFKGAIGLGTGDYSNEGGSFKRLDRGEMGHEEFIESWGVEPKKEGISDKIMRWFGK